MANLAGVLAAPLLHAYQAVLSPNLGAYTFGPAAPSRGTAFLSGMKALPGSFSPVVTWQATGEMEPMHGGVLFERILIQPRAVDARFVLSSQTWDVEVWNTHRAEAHVLTSITIEGPGNLQMEGPASMTYGPGQAQIYTATLPGPGDASIQVTASWVFPGETGTGMTVIGTRITAFPHRPDWSQPWAESVSYLTEVLSAYDGTEQRRALRAIPRYGCSFRVLSTSPLETASLESLLFGWQDRQFGVPWWPESCLLGADVAPGDMGLVVDTTDRPSFVAGGLVMLWTDFATWEAFQAESVTSGVIALGSQVTKSWKAGARVVPLRRGRLGDQGLDRPTNWLTAGTFTFSCEAV